MNFKIWIQLWIA